MKLLNERQNKAVTFIRKTPKCYLAADPGLGKTKMALQSFDRAVIICPVSLIPNWKSEIKKWRPSKAGGKDYLLVPYSLIHKTNWEEIFPFYKNLIVDEAHFLKNPTAIRTMVGCDLIRKMERVVALSGSAIPNRVAELYPVINAMGIMQMTFRTFAIRYCNARLMPWGWDYSGASNVEELKQRIYPYFFIMKKAELLPDLAAKKFIISEIDMPLNPLEARLHLDKIKVSKRPKGIVGLAEILRQDAERKVPYSAAYIKKFLVEHPGVKCLVFGIHSKGLEDLAEALSEFYPSLVYGKTKKNRLEVVDAFKANANSRVLIGHITVAGVGFTINEAPNIFFHESSWSIGDIEQASSRSHRIGSTKQVVVTFLTIKNSFDSYIIKKMLNKAKLIKGIL